MFLGKKFSGPSQSCLNFIENEQGIMPVTNFASFFQITGRWHYDSPFALNGFHQKGNGVWSDDPFKSFRIPEGDGDDQGAKGPNPSLYCDSELNPTMVVVRPWKLLAQTMISAKSSGISLIL